MTKIAHKSNFKLPEQVLALAEQAGVIRITETGPVLLREATFEDFENFVVTLGHRWLGINNPFICGASDEKDSVGLPTTLLICPSFGADGFAVYKKATEYSAPSY